MAKFRKKRKRLQRRKLLAAYLALDLMDETREKRFAVHQINLRRNIYGEFCHMFEDLKSDEDKFYSYFRMGWQQFETLLDKCRIHLMKFSNVEPISPVQRLAITLRYFANGIDHKVLAESYRLGKSTVSVIISETSRVLYNMLQPEFLCVPETGDQWKEVAGAFWKKWQLPNCIGAIDGKHVAIRPPKGSGSKLFNYKHFHSLVLLAVCDADCNFLYIDVGGAGRLNDGGLYASSDFRRAIEAGTLNIPLDDFLPLSDLMFSYYFVGDAAFPLRTFLLRPYSKRSGALEEYERIFNYRLSRGRRCIENSFGMMTAKWRILKKTLETSPPNCVAIVKALCCLHNFCKLSGPTGGHNAYFSERLIDMEQKNGEIRCGNWRKICGSDTAVFRIQNRQQGMRSTRLSVEKRDELAEFFVGVGAVPWQDDIVARDVQF